MENNIKLGLDIASLSTVIATLIGWLPNVAALLSIVWLSIQIYDWYKKKDTE